MTDSAYPYTAEDGTCKFKAGSVVANITGITCCSIFGTISQVKCRKCTFNLAYQLLQSGAARVGIDGGTKLFQKYQSGILKDTICSQDNHAVTLVGYGTSGSTQFFKIRNSWELVGEGG